VCFLSGQSRIRAGAGGGVRTLQRGPADALVPRADGAVPAAGDERALHAAADRLDGAQGGDAARVAGVRADGAQRRAVEEVDGVRGRRGGGGVVARGAGEREDVRVREPGGGERARGLVQCRGRAQGLHGRRRGGRRELRERRREGGGAGTGNRRREQAGDAGKGGYKRRPRLDAPWRHQPQPRPPLACPLFPSSPAPSLAPRQPQRLLHSLAPRSFNPPRRAFSFSFSLSSRTTASHPASHSSVPIPADAFKSFVYTYTVPSTYS
jgi:hypothetical protein